MSFIIVYFCSVCRRIFLRIMPTYTAFPHLQCLIALPTNDVMKFQTPLVTQTNKLQFYKSRKGKYVREVVKTIILARDPPKLIETTVSYGSPPPPHPDTNGFHDNPPPPLIRRCMVSSIAPPPSRRDPWYLL